MAKASKKVSKKAETPKKVAVAKYSVQIDGGNGGVVHIPELSDLGAIATDALHQNRSVTLKVALK